MSNDHDPQMQAWLRSEDAPEHRPGFWTDLRAEMEEVSTQEKDAAPVISIDKFRRHMPLVLVAAAAVVVAAVVGFGALRDKDDDVGVTTEPGIEDGESEGPDTPDSTPDTTLDSTPDTDRGALTLDGEPIERGSGSVVGISPDGQWLYVADDAGADEMSCEGSNRLALYVEPVDGGERRLAVPSADLDATTVSAVHFDGEGRFATVVQCEGFGARIVTGDVADDGTVTGTQELTLPETECHDGPVDGIFDIAYIGPGELAAATHSFGEGDDGCYHLYSLSDTASEPVLVSKGTAVFQVEAAAGGPLVSAGDSSVAVDGTEIFSIGGVSDMDLSPSGQSVAVAGFGDDGSEADDVVVRLDGNESGAFATAAYEVVLLDDLNGLMTTDRNEKRVLATFRAGEPDVSIPVVEGNVLGFVPTPNGDRVFVSVTDDDGSNVRLIEQKLAD